MQKRPRTDKIGADTFAQNEIIDVTRTPAHKAGEVIRGKDSRESGTPMYVSYDGYLDNNSIDARSFLLAEDRVVITFLCGRSIVCSRQEASRHRLRHVGSSGGILETNDLSLTDFRLVARLEDSLFVEHIGKAFIN